MFPGCGLTGRDSRRRVGISRARLPTMHRARARARARGRVRVRVRARGRGRGRIMEGGCPQPPRTWHLENGATPAPTSASVPRLPTAPPGCMSMTVWARSCPGRNTGRTRAVRFAESAGPPIFVVSFIASFVGVADFRIRQGLRQGVRTIPIRATLSPRGAAFQAASWIGNDPAEDGRATVRSVRYFPGDNSPDQSRADN